MTVSTNSTRNAIRLPRRARWACLTLLALPLLLPEGSIHATPGEPIVRIEQDWKVMLNVPNSDMFTPQFHTVMSPTGNLDSYYFQATWNWREDPYFFPGGLQLQFWDDDTLVGKKGYRSEPISKEEEVIVWTQVLEVQGAVVKFYIKNGSSVSWGTFGGETMQLVATGTGITSLNGYSTSVSAEESWVSFGANRVDSIQILEVRHYTASGLAFAESEPVTVYELED